MPELDPLIALTNSTQGLRKAAILLVSLEPDYAAQVMSNLEREDVERIAFEIARLSEVTKDERDQVFDEFYKLNLARQYVDQGGVGQARLLLEKSLGTSVANEVMALLETDMKEKPFVFLQSAEAETLTSYIQEEHPQTIALILSHVAPRLASDILTKLPSDRQVEVVKRVAVMERTDPVVIRQVEKVLAAKLTGLMAQEFQQAGGVPTVAEMLNLADRATERGILETIEEEDPELVEQIRRLMFVFEDLMLVNDRGIQNVLKEIDNEELALALKGASQELKDKIFNNMSTRAAELVKEEMEYMGPVRVSDVEAAQQTIVDVVRRLEESGDVIIQGRGGGEEVIE